MSWQISKRSGQYLIIALPRSIFIIWADFKGKLFSKLFIPLRSLGQKSLHFTQNKNHIIGLSPYNLPHFYVITELPGSSTVWHYVNNIVGTLVWQFSKVDKQNLLIHPDSDRNSQRPDHNYTVFLVKNEIY